MASVTAETQVRPEALVLPIIAAASFCHMLNDIMQSLLTSLYPLLKENYALSFVQIGLLTFAFQVTASLLQPGVGMITDRWTIPFSLPAAMLSTCAGLLTLAFADDFGLLVLGACLIGIGSAIFHPEASRVSASRIGRTARSGAVFLPGRRKHRHGDRAAARGLHRHPARAGEPRMVLVDRTDRLCRPVLGQPVAQSPPPERRGSRKDRPSAALAAQSGPCHAWRADGSDCDQERLSRQHFELFHLLCHREVPGGRPAGTDDALSLSRRLGYRRAARRADRRPLRIARRHLVLDPRRHPVRPGPALCRPILDIRAGGRDRLRLLVGFFGDRRLRAKNWCPAGSA